jgi:hypothetical protein
MFTRYELEYLRALVGAEQSFEPESRHLEDDVPDDLADKLKGAAPSPHAEALHAIRAILGNPYNSAADCYDLVSVELAAIGLPVPDHDELEEEDAE